MPPCGARLFTKFFQAAPLPALARYRGGVAGVLHHCGSGAPDVERRAVITLKRYTINNKKCNSTPRQPHSILAKGAIALPMTPSGGVLFAS